MKPAYNKHDRAALVKDVRSFQPWPLLWAFLEMEIKNSATGRQIDDENFLYSARLVFKIFAIFRNTGLDLFSLADFDVIAF